MSQKTGKITVTTIKGTDADYLREARDCGLLNGEALVKVERVLKENESLKRDNAFIKGLMHDKNATIKAFQKTALEAMKYKAECESRNKRKELICWIISGSVVALSIAAFVTVLNVVH